MAWLAPWQEVPLTYSLIHQQCFLLLLHGQCFAGLRGVCTCLLHSLLLADQERLRVLDLLGNKTLCACACAFKNAALIVGYISSSSPKLLCVVCCVATCCYVLLCVVVCCCVLLCVVVCCWFGPSPPDAGALDPPTRDLPSAGQPKFSLFSPLPPKFALFFSLSLGVFSWNFGGVFEAPEPLNCSRLGCRVKPRRPRNRRGFTRQSEPNGHI